MADYLLEIGLEEIPAHLVTSAENQLVSRSEDFLKEHLLHYDHVLPFSTPRRLAILVKNLADFSDSTDEEHRGPSLKVAKDSDGAWTKAAQGFARGQKMSPDDFTEKDGYVYLTKHVEGVAASEILKNIATEVVEQMKFSTYMRWADFKLEYVRPIRWLVSLLGTDVVPFTVLDVKAGRVTRGHRFLNTGEVEIAQADDYEKDLADAFVIANAQTRKETIRKQIHELADQHGWHLHIDQDLLEEVNNIVEYPTAFAGSFSEKYLSLPDIVLITSMRDNQRFFYLTDEQGQLLPHFISVRNGNGDHLDNVISGNEKVLIARLEDAKFFFQEDQKHSIDFFMAKADHLIFHAKIGTVVQHMARVSKIAALLADKMGFSESETQDLQRASQIYKFDLTTAMVGEFSELQGTMAGIYAGLFGENAVVSQALSEQYLPNSSEGSLPQSRVGALLALSDKLDSLFSFFACGLIPSGSNDPYGLRRAALGMVRIIADQKWRFSLKELLTNLNGLVLAKQGSFAEIQDQNLTRINAQLNAFIVDRIRQLSDGSRYDLLDAATSKIEQGDVELILRRISFLASHADDTNFKAVVEALARVQSLAEKNPSQEQVDPDLFVNDSEKALYSASQAYLAEQISQLKDQGIYDYFVSLKDPINDYFDSNMILDKDPQIKKNRLAQINLLNDQISTFGDFRKIVTK
ncbi:glycine--tRNA ligase subunit beta [Oenococcus kitaharae]|uniref:Glycine--tRNA ligase beta subunit n=1 Tax=Oenococcus kitaharae DSM 17330 TaxID=1045004 RepID=G9WH47_9LACO|nr:glycine--tRNA ligase subunit beta [Oenococcus kitaharae]EHN59536.1 Glycyl-tRNA synthetase beta chain [Oenococcus kitaharae DSM 17330]OEY83389.1 glycine-tRNA synthetase subunit beta [Oenococcus kitaharae]OEY85188.1 glycine-tRNA synthetase subunit beta [Oenococcus kitaharae]OEY86042.1 glycine-tRNA synthetase subunit beta [Oenococcus kitaharae]